MKKIFRKNLISLLAVSLIFTMGAILLPQSVSAQAIGSTCTTRTGLPGTIQAGRNGTANYCAANDQAAAARAYENKGCDITDITCAFIQNVIPTIAGSILEFVGLIV